MSEDQRSQDRGHGGRLLGPVPSTERGLSPRDLQLVDALARGLTAEEAAKVSGYSERTIRRRRRALRAEIAAQVRENLDQGVRELQAGIGEAARALRGMANGTVEGTPVRASAARAVIELGLRGAEMLEVLPRLAELEQLVLEARGHRRVS